ncbi:hypothetical protein D3C81_2023700 [compost metagenome]
MLAHFFLNVLDLLAHFLVYIFDVRQFIQCAQAYDQAEQRCSSIQHQIVVAAP